MRFPRASYRNHHGESLNVIPSCKHLKFSNNFLCHVVLVRESERNLQCSYVYFLDNDTQAAIHLNFENRVLKSESFLSTNICVRVFDSRNRYHTAFEMNFQFSFMEYSCFETIFIELIFNLLKIEPGDNPISLNFSQVLLCF